MGRAREAVKRRDQVQKKKEVAEPNFTGTGTIIAICIATISVIVYLYYPASAPYNRGAPDTTSGYTSKSSNFSQHLTDSDWSKWNTLIGWLIENGMPDNFLLTLAYFEHSGRGVACTRDIEAETPVVVIPFSVMMTTSHARTKTYIDDAMIALFLLTEKLKPDSFWRPYIDFLPADYSEMALFLTTEDKEYMEGLLEPTLNYELNELNTILEVAKRVEQEEPEVFKGLANETALKWALVAVWSRMWQIEEVGGRALVPLADLLNHHPEKGTVLVPNAERETGTIKALQSYKEGAEFYDKYFMEKVESDGVYYATFNYFSTYPLDYYWVRASKPKIQSILNKQGCSGTGPAKAAVSELVAEKGLPQKWVECMQILALDEVQDNETNYLNHMDSVERRGLELGLSYFKDKLAGYQTGTVAEDSALLLNEALTKNMRTLITLRMNEKLVLNTTIIYIQQLISSL